MRIRMRSWWLAVATAALWILAQTVTAFADGITWPVG
jgi:uncharacterized membrane protein